MAFMNQIQYRTLPAARMHWRSVRCVVVMLGILFVGCGPSRMLPATPTPMEPVEDNTLGPGDLFDVRVYGEKELSNEFRVASDGTIDFPLIGTVVVSELTPSQVKEKLEQLLIEGDYLRAPQISILVKEYKSKKISVFGQVNKPGTFPYQEGMGVVEAVSIAGGFTPMARTDNTTVTRVADGQKQNFIVPVEKIGTGQEKDFVLGPGDIVFVPERVF